LFPEELPLSTATSRGADATATLVDGVPASMLWFGRLAFACLGSA
jgi:hypothetical protein